MGCALEASRSLPPKAQSIWNRGYWVYPNGISSRSPGLRVARYPGSLAAQNHYPNGVASTSERFPMPQSLSVVYLHLVFSTKIRRPFLRDRQVREKLHAYLGEASKRLDCAPVLVGGVEDHVHILARFGRTISPKPNG